LTERRMSESGESKGKKNDGAIGLESSPFFYSVTAQAATTVDKSVVGHFTSATDSNLIVSKGSQIELYNLAPEGLVGITSIPVYGNIVTMELFHPRNETQDALMILTRKLDCSVLFWNSATGAIETRAAGNVSERIGRLSDAGFLTAIDPTNRVLVMHLYDGFIKVIPIGAKGEMNEAYSLRVEEMNIVDMKFLYGCERPTLALLYSDCRDNRNVRHLKTYELTKSGRSYDLKRGPLAMSNIDAESNLIIPVTFGGCLVLGERVLSYHSIAPAKNWEKRQFGGAMADDGSDAGSSVPDVRPPVSFAVRPTIFRAWARVDKTTFLLGDHAGKLSLLTLDADRDGRVLDIRMEYLGITSIASTISYLDNSYVYVGSHLGDSQLVQIVTSTEGRNLNIVDSYLNVGPIMDFVVVDFDQRGQGQVVTCSGGFKDGAVHVIRNGIGISDISSSEIPGIQNLWSLSSGDDNANDKYLVLSFASGTEVLEMKGSTLALSTVQGFDRSVPTLCCCSSIIPGRCVQITSNEVRHINLLEGGSVIHVFHPEGETIKVASCGTGASELLLSLGNGVIVYLSMNQKGEFVLRQRKNLGSEVACMDIGTTATTVASTKMRSHGFCAIGCWDMKVHTLALPSLDIVDSYTLEGSELPRSILLAEVDEVIDDGPVPLYLLCGLGDGHLFSFIVNRESGKLSGWRKMSLGTGPVTLTPIRCYSKNNALHCVVQRTTHVFACSNRPTVIYSSSNANASSSGSSWLTRKLLLSNVNLRDVRCVCTFRNKSLLSCREEEEEKKQAFDKGAGSMDKVGGGRDTVALVTEGKLMLGTIDEIQKLHIHKFPHGEMPRRIAYQDQTRSFAILTVKTTTVHVSDSSSSQAAAAAAVPEDMCEDDACEEIDKGYVRLYDEQLLDNKDSYELQSNETGTSIASVFLADDTQPYFVVGTARILPLESEPSAGRILVFRVTSLGKLSLVAEKDVRGAVYSLDVLEGKLLAGINSHVHMFIWKDAEWYGESSEAKFNKSLVSHCEFTGQILALNVATIPTEDTAPSEDDDMMKDDGMDDDAALTAAAERSCKKLVVGDLMRGVSLLKYKPEEQKLEMVAMDPKPIWLSTVIPVDDKLFLAADSSMNLYTLVTNLDSKVPEDRDTLLRSGEYHLGDSVNCIRRGSLVMRSTDVVPTPSPALSASLLSQSAKTFSLSSSSNVAAAAADAAADVTAMSQSSSSSSQVAAEGDTLGNPLRTFVYGTANGGIGVLAQLTKEQYTFFMKVQENMTNVLSGIGGLTHSHWRTFVTEFESVPARRFVDGDLIEAFLDLSPDKMALAVKGLGLSVEELAKRIEAFQRATH